MSEPAEKLRQQNRFSSIANLRSSIANLYVRQEGIFNAVIAIFLTFCLATLIFFLSAFPGYAVFRLSLANRTVEVPWNYFILALASDILVRIVLRFFREWELRGSIFTRINLPPTNFWRSVWQAFWSIHPYQGANDYFVSFFTGLLELLAYPYFIVTWDLKVIGGWLALKTVAQWKEWTASRLSYQRFLLGNALVIAFSVPLGRMLSIQ